MSFYPKQIFWYNLFFFFPSSCGEYHKCCTFGNHIGAVYEYRWISQGLIVCDRFVWSRLPVARPNWQHGNTNRRAQVSCFARYRFLIELPQHNLINLFPFFPPNPKYREKLCGHLPARAEGYSWSLVFSTSQHGCSINSLYRKLQRIESPILVVIQDTENNVSLVLCIFFMHQHRRKFHLQWNETRTNVTIIWIFSIGCYRYLVHWHRVHYMYRSYFTEPVNHCCLNLIRISKYSTGLARICTLSKAIRKVCQLAPASKYPIKIISISSAVCCLVTNGISLLLSERYSYRLSTAFLTNIKLKL